MEDERRRMEMNEWAGRCGGGDRMNAEQGVMGMNERAC